MGYRTGFTLLQLLRETRAMTEIEEVKEYIDAAMGFIRPARGEGYQRGARLVNLLKRGGLVALAVEEVTVAERLMDFARYAAGEIPLTLLESYYVPAARAADDAMVQLLIKEATRRVAEGLDAFLAERHDAKTDEVRQWVHGLATAADHLNRRPRPWRHDAASGRS
jgi:hypothetical protein